MNTFTQTVACDLECYALLVSDTRELHGDRYLYPSRPSPQLLSPSAPYPCNCFNIVSVPTPSLQQPSPSPSILVPKSDKHRKVKSERMGSAVGDMKPSFCNSFFWHFPYLHACSTYIRELLSPLSWFYRKLCHHSGGTTMNVVLIPAITVVFVIKFNPITVILLSSPSPCSSLSDTKLHKSVTRYGYYKYK